MARLPESRKPSDITRGCVLFVGGDRALCLELATLLADLRLGLCPAACSADEAVHHARAYRPVLVLMETRLEGGGDGVLAAAQLRQELGLRVVYIVDDSDVGNIERSNQTLPYGYLLRPIRHGDLRCCLELALHYRLFEPRPSERASASPSLQALSAREVEVLKLIARGYTIKDIAKALNIATPTVGSSRVDLQACKLEYSIVSPK